MEDLWKLRDMNYRLQDLADRAEYNRIVKRFHEEEERNNMRMLLYGEPPAPKPAKKSDPSDSA